MDIIQYLKLRDIPAEERANNELWFCCPFHNGDDTPSCSINKETEKWNCFGCGASGANLNSFEYLLNTKGIKGGKEQKTFDESLVMEKHQALMSNSNVLTKLWDERRISTKVIKQFKIGWDGTKVWIPIYYEDKILNVKVWDALKLNHVKTSWLGKSSEGYTTNGFIFPYSNLKESEIFYTEGEGDCLAALSAGYNAVTGGGTGFDFVYILSHLKGKKVTLCYDNDEPGKKAARKSVERLRSSKVGVREVKLDKLGASAGQDFTDCLVSTPDFRKKLDEYLHDLDFNEVVVVKNKLNLCEGLDASYYKKTISFKAHIISVAVAPKQIAKKIMVIHEENGKEFFEISIEDKPELALGLYTSNIKTEYQTLRAVFGIDKESKIVVLETQNLLEMTVQQDFQYTDDIKDPVNFQVKAYTTDYKISPFKTYEFTAKVVRDPITFEAAFMIHGCATQDLVRSNLTDADLTWLKLFNVKG